MLPRFLSLIFGLRRRLYLFLLVIHRRRLLHCDFLLFSFRFTLRWSLNDIFYAGMSKAQGKARLTTQDQAIIGVPQANLQAIAQQNDLVRTDFLAINERAVGYMLG